MPDSHDYDAEQLNNASAPREEIFSLDDIMREFGGWTKREEPADEPEPEQEAPEKTVPEPEEPKEPEPQPEPEQPKTPKFRFIEVDLNAPKADIEAAMEAAAVPEPEPEQRPVDRSGEEPPQIRVLPAHEKKKKRRADSARQQQVSVGAAYASCKRSLQTLQLRTLGVLLLAMIALFLTLASGYGWKLASALPSGRTLAMLLACLQIASGLLSLDLLLRGVRQAVMMKFNLESSLVLCFAAVLLDAIAAIAKDRVPLCAPVCLALLLADWGYLQRQLAMLRILKLMIDAKEAEILVNKPSFWHETDCLLHLPLDRELTAECLLEPDGCEKALRVYCPMSAAAAIVFSVVISALSHNDLIWVLAVMLTGSLPVMGFFCFTRPWHILTKHLQKSGAAVLGWPGVRSLCGQRYLVATGSDLFPSANISFNGLKVFGDFRVNQVVSYAGTLMSASESELEPLFRDLMQEYGAKMYSIGSFRRYEGGGFGAEIVGDVALAGSQRFMRLMGVRLPDDLNVSQALYLSINGELAGVFALSYKASATVRSSLLALQHSKNLTTLMATRDFLVSPQMLSKRYKIASDSLEFPAVRDRVELSDPTISTEGTTCALLSKKGFSPYAGVALGARSLRAVTRWGVFFSVISGLLGLLIMLILTRVGAEATASASNLAQYMILWLIPSLLLGLWVRR